MRAAWFIVVLGACGSVAKHEPDPVDANPANPADSNPGDASVPDGMVVPGIDANPCSGSGTVKLCLDTLPREPLVFAVSKQIDTDHDSRCASFTPANPAWCVIAAPTITIAKGATLSAIGAHALVIVATEAMQIDGTLDVSSHQLSSVMRVHGAGTEPAECSTGSQGAGLQGGGYGGSFTSKGGNGGVGGGGIAGNSGGAANAAAVTKLRAGCRGSGGGYYDPDSGYGGDGGDGGGAVYVLAPSITVSETGVITASGAPGRGATNSGCGAGGGGSGGMIALESPALVLEAGAHLFANGAGGGEGAGCTGNGSNGEEPKSPTAPALGGRGQAEGGNGGDGSVATGAGEPGGAGLACTYAAGGGGGGGGGGAVVLLGGLTDRGAQISPPPKLTL